MSVRTSDLIIIALIFPPGAVFFITGCGRDLLINICLVILGYIPAYIHVFWLIYRRMKAEETYGRVRYYYVGYGTFEPVPNVQLIGAQTPYQQRYGATAGGRWEGGER